MLVVLPLRDLLNMDKAVRPRIECVTASSEPDLS